MSNNSDKKAVLKFLDYHTSSDTQPDTGNETVSMRAGNALKGGNTSEGTDAYTKEGLKDGVLYVQYNPSKISFSAHVKEKIASEEEQSYKIATLTDSSTLVMSTELLFFSEDEEAEDVREKMELFFEMLGYSGTNNVSFSWGKFTFSGRVSSFSGEYTMFDESGNPIAGKVNLSIEGIGGERILSKSYEAITEA